MSSGVTTTFQSTIVRAEVAPRRASVLLIGESSSVGIALREGHSVVVGRASPSDVVLEDRALSRRHARLTWRGEGLFVEDLGSTNGTLVDGERVAQATVAPSQSLSLGGVEVRVHVSRFVPSASGDRATEDFEAAVAAELARGKVFGRATTVLAVRNASDELRASGEVEWLRRLGAALRPVDRVAPYARSVGLVLVAEVDELAVTTWVARARAAVEPAPLLFGAAVAPSHADDASALVQAALGALRRASLREIAFAPHVRTNAERREGAEASREIVIASPPMRALHATVERVARTKLPVLILGETGAGKEHVAHALHARSPRASGPFKAVNCAALPATLLESTLFGHEKGAFTGATERASGLFEQADGGTVFLDEIGELPLPAQAALLRVLETKKLVRVGGTKELEVDVRVVAATHRDLEAMVEAGTLRADLLYRLDALTLEVPALRERVEDVVPLARAFLSRARTQWETSAIDFDDAALDALCAHDWPGNVRQLKNVVERAAAMALGACITLADLPPDLARAARPEPTVVRAEEARSLADRVEAFERQILGEVLEQTGGNQSEAARVLRIPRRTLAHKAKRLGLV
jgi:DNA-binding NtrC family response regulator